MNCMLIQYLNCPNCSGILSWNIIDLQYENIIKASMYCANCAAEYFVHDGIACFVSTKNEFQQALEYEKELTSNSTEKYIYTSDTQKAIDECIQATNKEIMNIHSGSIILDFAAGHGTLFTNLCKRTDLIYIVNDIDIGSLIHIKIANQSKDEINVNYLAFDARYSPFRNKCITFALSLLGLQHIVDYQTCLLELKRIVANDIIHISSFCPENDKLNLFVLKSKKLLDMWLENNFYKVLSFHNINYNIIYKTQAFVKGVEKEKGQKYIGKDNFPVTDTTFYYSVTKLY